MVLIHLAHVRYLNSLRMDTKGLPLNPPLLTMMIVHLLQDKILHPPPPDENGRALVMARLICQPPLHHPPRDVDVIGQHQLARNCAAFARSHHLAANVVARVPLHGELAQTAAQVKAVAVIMPDMHIQGHALAPPASVDVV